MLILTIRTDKPEAELGLFADNKRLAYVKWQAHRQLSETIHRKIEELLKAQSKDWSDIEGVVCFQGPGSFTGLRIGLTVGNALANGLNIPIVASQGDWLGSGIERLQQGENERITVPHYGAPANTTLPRH